MIAKLAAMVWFPVTVDVKVQLVTGPTEALRPPARVDDVVAGIRSDRDEVWSWPQVTVTERRLAQIDAVGRRRWR